MAVLTEKDRAKAIECAMTNTTETTVFERWLEEHKADPVGTIEESDRCPIARFILATCPEFEHVSVSGQPYIEVYFGDYNEDPIRVEVPPWTSEFVSRVDSLSLFDRDDRYVTGEEALKVLLEEAGWSEIGDTGEEDEDEYEDEDEEEEEEEW